MIRYLPGYLAFTFLRLILVGAVGWVALDYAAERYDTVAIALDRLAAALH